MLAWFERLDPNVVVPMIGALLAFLYHHLLSPAAQDKIASGIARGLYAADSVMSALVAASPPGTTKQGIEERLWNAAKLQLAHIGLDVDKLPPALESQARALVAKYLAQLPDASSGTATGKPQEVPVVQIPPPIPSIPPLPKESK